MDISNVCSGQGVAGSYAAQQRTSAAYASSAGKAAASDTLHISEEAKQLAQSAQTSNNTAAITEDNLPVEAYSIPNWMGNLLTDLTMLDPKLGQPYSESKIAQYDALSSKDKEYLSEYQDTVFEYFRDGLKSMGIEGDVDYYKNIVLNEKNSEELHQYVRNRLDEDPQAKAMMQYFGVV